MMHGIQLLLNGYRGHLPLCILCSCRAGKKYPADLRDPLPPHEIPLVINPLYQMGPDDRSWEGRS